MGEMTGRDALTRGGNALLPWKYKFQPDCCIANGYVCWNNGINR